MRKLISLFVLLALILAPFSIVSNIKTEAQAYRGLVIDEFVFNLNKVQRGTSVKESFTVTHDFEQRDKKVTLYVRALDFTSDGVSGIPVFIKPGTLSYEASMASWITFERSTIKMDHYGQKETIKFTVNVPQNAEAGGKYAVVLVGENPPQDSLDFNDDKSQVALAKELGPLVLLTTDGPINKQLAANSLYTLTIRGRKTKFFTTPPVKIVAKMNNIGNVHAIPRGVIYVHRGDKFQEYDARYEMNDKKGYVLPGTVREFYADWTEGFLTKELQKQSDGSQKLVTKINWDKLSKFRIGKYNVTLLYSYEDNNGAAVSNTLTTHFWMIPWQLVLLVVLIILAIAMKVAMSLRKKKEHSQKRKSK